MANIIKSNVNINFADKVWSTSEILNDYPWAMVGVESEATFNGNVTDKQFITYDDNRNEVINHEYIGGGVDTYSNLTKNQFNSKTDYSQAVTIGRMNTATGKLTINGGFYASPATAIYVAQGVCIINGGVFFSQPDHSTTPKSGHEAEKYPYGRIFELNLYDSKGKSGEAAIYVTGGSFIGFDPADNFAEGDNTNFVCTGYKSVEDGVYTYTVKDAFLEGNGMGELRTVKIYTVVPESDDREGISGNKTLPTE